MDGFIGFNREIPCLRTRIEKTIELDKKELEWLISPDRDKGVLYRKEIQTVSDIVKMVERGEPVNGIQRSFPEDDDEDGVNDDPTVSDDENDRRDFKKHEEVFAARQYLDPDPVIALQQIGEVQNVLRQEVQQPEQKPELTPDPGDPEEAGTNLDSGTE